jgi:hypothetical protein
LANPEGAGVKLVRENLSPLYIFWVFFLVGPAFAGLLQLLLLNALFLGISPIPLWLFVPMEISGLVETALVLLFGFPVSFLAAVCAIYSYLVLRRVSLLIVFAAVLLAIWLEYDLASDIYFSYFASHGLRGPWTPGDEGPHPRQAILLCWLLHLVPVSICWWIVRKKRLPPV